MTTGTPLGRPRDAAVSLAVAGAVISVLRELGFAGLTMDAVASKAGVSKASIYRRWASKEDLLVDVIANLASENPVPDTGHVRDDLVELLHRTEAFLSDIEAGQIFPRMAAEVHAASELGRRYAEQVIMPRRAILAGMLSGARARGELRDDLDIDMAVDMLTGPVILRMLLGRFAPSHADWAEKLVDGLLRGWAADR
jgi:AcrR family transcriptional regulator